MRMLAAGCISLLLTIANTAQAQDLAGPILLVAAPDTEGFYTRAVVIAVPVGFGQHVGFIVNRPSKHTLARVFPAHKPSKKVSDPIYIGGPDAVGTIFAFVRAKTAPSADSLHLFDDLFVTANARALTRIVERTPNAARYMTGYISWMEDELEMEVENGLWHLSEPKVEMLFRKDPAALWAELIVKTPSPVDMLKWVGAEVPVETSLSSTHRSGPCF